MSSEGIYFKKIDRKMYRKLKSAAAERGVPVYALLNEAIAAYVESQGNRSPEGALTQDEVDNVAFALIEAEASLKGKWVGIANGKLVGNSDSEQEVIELMARAYARSRFRHGIVARVGESREQREWLAGSIQS